MELCVPAKCLYVEAPNRHVTEFGVSKSLRFSELRRVEPSSKRISALIREATGKLSFPLPQGRTQGEGDSLQVRKRITRN